MYNIIPDIKNPFNAPVYHMQAVSSTMDISRLLAKEGAMHGTVITADFQEAGRGRILGRSWEMQEGSLPFTILLRFQDIPSALTLRAGLAVTHAIEDFAPALKGSVFVKWPNDIMIGSKKTAGILCEADYSAGFEVHLGIGINMIQKEFPAHLQKKATSLALAAGEIGGRFALLEKILAHLYNELNATDWKTRLEKRLYKKDESVLFIEGAADSGREVRGRLAGIGEGGELLILPDGDGDVLSFVSGELVL